MKATVVLVAVLLVAQNCWAGLVDHSSTGIVAFAPSSDTAYSGHVLMADGTAWFYYVPGEAGVSPFNLQDHQGPLPIPISQIKSWTLNSFLDVDGNLWGYTSGADGTRWYNLGAPPVAPVESLNTSVGAVKGARIPRTSGDPEHDK